MGCVECSTWRCRPATRASAAATCMGTARASVSSGTEPCGPDRKVGPCAALTGMTCFAGSLGADLNSDAVKECGGKV